MNKQEKELYRLDFCCYTKWTRQKIEANSLTRHQRLSLFFLWILAWTYYYLVSNFRKVDLGLEMRDEIIVQPQSIARLHKKRRQESEAHLYFFYTMNFPFSPMCTSTNTLYLVSLWNRIQSTSVRTQRSINNKLSTTLQRLSMLIIALRRYSSCTALWWTFASLQSELQWQDITF
jgi:hypothetical protein